MHTCQDLIHGQKTCLSPYMKLVTGDQEKWRHCARLAAENGPPTLIWLFPFILSRMITLGHRLSIPLLDTSLGRKGHTARRSTSLILFAKRSRPSGSNKVHLVKPESTPEEDHESEYPTDTDDVLESREPSEEERLTAQYLASLDSQWTDDPPHHRSGAHLYHSSALVCSPIYAVPRLATKFQLYRFCGSTWSSKCWEEHTGEQHGGAEAVHCDSKGADHQAQNTKPHQRSRLPDDLLRYSRDYECNHLSNKQQS